MAQLAFSRYFPKKYHEVEKETFFQEKILTGLIQNDFEVDEKYLKKNPHLNYDLVCKVDPKIHTFRKVGAKQRKPGDKIHFTVNGRTKQSFQFAPVIPVTSVQIFEVIWNRIKPGTSEVSLIMDGEAFDPVCINGGLITRISDPVKQLIKNDGFSNPDIFFRWFNHSDIYEAINWTGHVYRKRSEFEKAIDETIKSNKDGKKG